MKVHQTDLYVEVNELEIESRYIEVPNSNSDLDYLLVRLNHSTIGKGLLCLSFMDI
jgi:hypothetical protein